MARVTRKEDCEIIEIPNHIKNKITVTGSGSLDLGPIERAEEALQELSVEFDTWIEDEVARLSAARDKVHKEGLDSRAGEDLYRIAHDIKGQGETLGYPLASIVCASMCKLLEGVDDHALIPLTIIDNHVDAVRRILRDGIKTVDHHMGRAVADRLIDVVLEFVDHIQAKQNA
jgi:chemotaxis protein histidine kinase CheA